jgi:predicted anti-sigma-YlaC factor YlaD
VSTDHESVRELLGGYLLGGLDESDQRLVDAHLRTCALCRDELDLLGPVPELLLRLPGGPPGTITQSGPPPAIHLEKLLSQVRARRRRLRRSLLTLVAGIVVVVGLAVGFALKPLSAEGGTTVAFTPVAQSSTSGHAVLTAKPWGTAVSVRMSGLPPTGLCVLQVVGRDGRVEQAATWGPTATDAVQVTGGSSMAVSAVRAVNVLGEGGRVLATATVD